MISATRSIHVQYKGGKILKSTCILNCEQINMHIESVHFNLVAKVAVDLSKFEDQTFSWKQYIFGKVVWHHLTST